jgi:hypothetical protein
MLCAAAAAAAALLAAPAAAQGITCPTITPADIVRSHAPGTRHSNAAATQQRAPPPPFCY